MRSIGTGKGSVSRRVAAGIVGCLVVAGVLGGCTSARSSLGTSDSSCYLALPTATNAVHGHGRLLGVHLVTLSALRKEAPRIFEALAADQPGSQRVCVAAFQGHYESASVSDPHGRATGPLAVVVVTTPSNHLLGTYIFTRVPLRFAHSHFG